MSYNISIVICIIVVGILIFVSAEDTSIIIYTTAAVAIDISILLFITSLKMDKISNLRLFAFFDENRRKILENLNIERTFDDLMTVCGGTNTTLSENLKYLKKAGLIKEKTEYVKQELQNDKMIRKFIRAF